MNNGIITIDRNNVELITNDIEVLSQNNGEYYHKNMLLANNINQSNSLINRYGRKEQEMQNIAYNEIAKYHFLSNLQNAILSKLNGFLVNGFLYISVWRYKNKFYYKPNYDSEIISGTKEEIATAIGSRLNCSLEFVDSLDKVRNKDIRKKGVNTVYIEIIRIPIVDEEVFDPNLSSGITNQWGITTRNILKYNCHLNKRVWMLEKPNNISSFLAKGLLNNLTTKKSDSIFTWFSFHYNNLARTDYILTLIHNTDVSLILWLRVITPIFGSQYCLDITEDILKTKSVKDIVKHKLFFKISYIPDDEDGLLKLREIIDSIMVGSYVKSCGDAITVYGKILIAVDEPNLLIDEYINHCKIFYVNSKDTIKSTLGLIDNISLHKSIDENLDLFSSELATFVKDENDLVFELASNGEYLNNQRLGINQKKNNKVMENTVSINTLEKFIPYENRFKHIYITGQIGSGKSEMLKALIMEIINKYNSSVVLLDPHGDLSLEIVRKIKGKERLIFVDPTLDNAKTPTINLFDIEDKSEQTIKEVAKVIMSVIKDMSQEDSFSASMSDVAENCISVLLRKGNSSFKELYRFLSDKRNKDLIELGRNSKNEFEREFFEDDFTTPSLTQTKDAVRRRLKVLINDPLFSNLMNGKSTVNLEKEINTKGKIIIFRVPKNKMLDTYKYYTRFILGLIQIIALKRADLDELQRVHTHLFIDEFHNFITPTIEEILTESRKYKLFLTLAHQSVSQIRNSKLCDIILSNTGTKIIGKNSNKTLDAINKTLNKKLENVENLKVGEFYIKSGTDELVKVKNSDELIGDNNSISSEEFEALKVYQLENYYRDIVVVDEATQMDRKIDEFKDALLSKDISYFKELEKPDKSLFEEIENNFNDEDGYIAQPNLNKYFNSVNSEFAIENKILLQKLKEKDDLFKQDVDKNRTYKSMKRYKL